MSQKHPLPHAVRHAQDLRKRSTKAEVAFWHTVRNRKFHGMKFRRQAPIGRFIVDFLCFRPPLIIELDGPMHDYQKRADARRTEIIMREYGIPVLRLRNDEVLNDLESVLKKIKSRLIP